MKATFRLTYQTGTPASDFAHQGFVSRTGNFNPARTYMPGKPAEFALRDAVRIFNNHNGHVEADSYPVSAPRWFNSCVEEYGGSVTLGLHIPAGVTDASRRRLARYVRCYGAK